MKDTVDKDRRVEPAAAILACLRRDQDDDWFVLQDILQRNLTERELARLAWTALRAMPGETAFDVAKGALECGWTFLPPLDPEDKREALSAARLWAADASQLEVKAVAMVALESMAPRSREGFMQWLKEKGMA